MQGGLELHLQTERCRPLFFLVEKVVEPVFNVIHRPGANDLDKHRFKSLPLVFFDEVDLFANCPHEFFEVFAIARLRNYGANEGHELVVSIHLQNLTTFATALRQGSRLYRQWS
jgi:hypothetical protein